MTFLSLIIWVASAPLLAKINCTKLFIWLSFKFTTHIDLRRIEDYMNKDGIQPFSPWSFECSKPDVLMHWAILAESNSAECYNST